MEYYKVIPNYMWDELKGKAITQSQLIEFACSHKIFDLTVEELANIAVEAGAVIIDLPKILNKKGNVKMAKIAFTKEDLIAACKIHGCDFSKNTINAILKELGDKATNAKQIHDCIYRWNIKDALTAEKKGKAGNNNLKDDFEKLSKVLNEGSTNEIAGNGEEVINNDPIKESVDKDVENVLINQETIEETSITKPRDLPVDNVNTEIGEDALEANPGLEESIAPETRFWPAEEPIRKPGMIGKMLKVAAVFGNFSNLLYSFNGEKIIINGHMPSLDPKDMDKLADEFLDVQQFFTNGAII